MPALMGLVGLPHASPKRIKVTKSRFPINLYCYTAERRLFPCSIAEGIPFILLLNSLKNKKG
jgi:hypothetical protein